MKIKKLKEGNNNKKDPSNTQQGFFKRMEN
jgi:hypothetical protein